jgi:hypothetical protein
MERNPVIHRSGIAVRSDASASPFSIGRVPRSPGFSSATISVASTWSRSTISSAHASRSIYKRTLETSELISINQATARSAHALFELHGPAANSDLRAGVEDMPPTASKTAFADYEERFVRSEYGVMMRYRAERILVDCLSANIEEITTVNGHATTKDKMINKTELSRGECRNWVVNVIGDPKQNDPKTEEQVLNPLPERAVWIAPGVPKTDAWMLGRATSNPQIALAAPGPWLFCDGGCGQVCIQSSCRRRKAVALTAFGCARAVRARWGT